MIFPVCSKDLRLNDQGLASFDIFDILGEKRGNPRRNDRTNSSFSQNPHNEPDNTRKRLVVYADSAEKQRRMRVRWKSKLADEILNFTTKSVTASQQL